MREYHRLIANTLMRENSFAISQNQEKEVFEDLFVLKLKMMKFISCCATIIIINMQVIKN